MRTLTALAAAATIAVAMATSMFAPTANAMKNSQGDKIGDVVVLACAFTATTYDVLTDVRSENAGDPVEFGENCAQAIGDLQADGFVLIETFPQVDPGCCNGVVHILNR
jgi:hypothetical protein